MKTNFFVESCLYAAVKGVGFLLQAMPLSWALRCGWVFGALAAWLQPKRRALGLNQLVAALGPERPIEELEAISRRIFQQLGMAFVEVLRTPLMDEAYIDRWITIEGREHFERAVTAGRGAVLVTGHYGNWELINLTAGLKGYPVSVLARQQGLRRLYELLNRYRESKGCRVISKGMAVRAMIRQLQQGEVVGILADQDAGFRGVLAPFFGRLASTATGPIALALQVGCPVIPVFIRRTGGPRHTLTLEPPLTLQHSGRLEEDVRAGVAAYLQVLERAVRRAPDQWLWMHRRWKSSPHRAMVVMSDGKPGHRTQALAVADLVEQVWAERAAQDPRLAPLDRNGRTGRTVIEVRFRSAWRRLLVTLAEAVGLTALIPSWRWLRWALMPENARALESAWATVAVSCGASAGLVNVIWSRSRAVRTIHVTRPPWPITRRVHLRIIPRHDGASPDASTLVTDGALPPAAPEPPATAGRVHLGLLLGGDSRQARLMPQQVQTVVTQLAEVAQQLNAELLVTTSRRTSKAVEEVVERVLGHEARRPDGSVPAILAAASAVVVSGESISMVSEAAASGKPVLVFEPLARRPRPKYRRFLARLAGQGVIRLVPPAQLGRELLEVVRDGRTRPTLNDRAVVLEGLRRWL